MNHEPDPPRNVRIVDHRGHLRPVEVRYLGVADGGIHQWEVILPDDVYALRVAMDLLPARTAVRLPMGPTDE